MIFALTVDVNLHGGTSGTTTAIIAALSALAGALIGALASIGAEWYRNSQTLSREHAQRALQLQIASREIYRELVADYVEISNWHIETRPKVKSESWQAYSKDLAGAEGTVWNDCSAAYYSITSFESLVHVTYSIEPPPEELFNTAREMKDRTIVPSVAKAMKSLHGPGRISVRTPPEALDTKTDPVPEPTGRDGKRPEKAESDKAPGTEAESS